jgi:hypothetical protein
MITTSSLAALFRRDVPQVETCALLLYVSSTPAARRALEDARALVALLRDLHDGAWRRPSPPRRHLAGPHYDVQRHVEAVLETRWPRRFAGRPVVGEPRPSLDEVDEIVDLAIVAIPPYLDRARLRAIAHETVTRTLTVGAWPFHHLRFEQDDEAPRR